MDSFRIDSGLLFRLDAGMDILHRHADRLGHHLSDTHSETLSRPDSVEFTLPGPAHLTAEFTRRHTFSPAEYP